MLQPVLHPDIYVYAAVDATMDIDALCTFREEEGLTLILKKDDAIDHNLAYQYECRWITLSLPTELEAIGITAAVSKALAAKNIPCNIVAALHHDHVFIPVKDAKLAVETLETVSLPI